MTDVKKLVEINNSLEKLYSERKELRAKLDPISNKIRELDGQKRKLMRKALVGKYLHQTDIVGDGWYEEKFIHVVSSDNGNVAIVERIKILHQPIKKDAISEKDYKVVKISYRPELETDLFLLDPKGLGSNSTEITKEQFFDKKAQLMKQLELMAGNQKEDADGKSCKDASEKEDNN